MDQPIYQTVDQQTHYDLQNPERSFCHHSKQFFEFNKTQTRKKHNHTLRTYQPRGNIDKFAFVQRSIPELLFKQLDGAVQGLARETPTAKPVAVIGILASHTHTSSSSR